MTEKAEKILYKWFEMKYRVYDKLEYDDSIYLYYDDMEIADIRVDKKDGFTYYKWDLYKEFCEIIHIEHVEFKQVMTNWVGDTFNLKRFTPIALSGRRGGGLKIPK